MPRTKQSSTLTLKDVRTLPWPSAVQDKDKPLNVTDCYRVGELILENLDWTETRGRQEWSLRRLQSQVLKDASVSTLSRCVRVYRIAKELGMKPPWNNLDMRHFVATASLPAPKRKALLLKVEKQGWSVMKLEQLVKETYGTPGRGGKTSVECVRALDQLERRDLFADLNRLNLYQKADLKKLAKRAEDAEAIFKRLRKELRAFGV
jgi:hypothetical protein